MKTAAPKTFAELRERYTPHAAVVFVLLALLVLGRMFFGGSSTPNRSAARNRNRSAIASRTPPAIPNSPSTTSRASNQEAEVDSAVPLVPLDHTWTIPALPEARRNIFAYYVAPPKSSVATNSPSPILTPPPVVTPVPPTLTATNLSPGSVYARTGEFTLQVSGDKFTPDVRIYVNARELPTVFTSPQQLSAKVPADVIASAGAHQVVVRTPDNQFFSNPLALNVNAPPAPSYDYIGIIGEKRNNKDTAVLKDKTGGKLHNVQRNDLVGGRFKVTAISDKAIEFTDVELNIKHTIEFSKATASPSGATVPAFSG